LRYDLHPGWIEREGRLAFFDTTSGAIVVADDGMNKISPLMPSSYVGIVSASSQGLPPDTLVRTDRNNFAPRLGVAWRPFNDSRTVIRAGYGLYYDLLPIELQAARAPFVFTETPFTNPAAPSLVLPSVFPAAGTAGPSSIALPLAVNPHLTLPYSHQWSATVEHAAFRVVSFEPAAMGWLSQHSGAILGRPCLSSHRNA